jgi:hypothetical protein
VLRSAREGLHGRRLLRRNVRAIEVLLLDRDAIHTGAADGEPFEYYDLGHGYCSYSFFEQCPHRIPCDRCDFYLPKDSSSARLLEANASLQRMLVEDPLTDDERAAVENDQNAVGRQAIQKRAGCRPIAPTPRARRPNVRSRGSSRASVRVVIQPTFVKLPARMIARGMQAPALEPLTRVNFSFGPVSLNL